MAISLVQSKSAFTNAATASLTVTPSAATTAGNLLLLVVSRGSGSTDPTFTAPAGWLSLGTVQYSDGWNATSGQAWYYPNNPGGIASVTVTSSVNFGASGAGELYLLEFSGVATTTPLDTHNEAVASSFTTTPSISTTTTTDGDLVVGFVVNDVGHAGGTITEPASPWTGLAAATDGQGWIALGVAYQVQTTHGAITYNPTFSAANDWILWIASFKAAGGGGTSVFANAESDGTGQGTATDALSTPAVGAGSGQASAAAAVYARAESDGSGQAVASGAVFVPGAQSVGAGQATGLAALYVLPLGVGAGSGVAPLAGVLLWAMGESDGSGALSAAVVIVARFPALASLSDATVAGATLADTAISGDTLSDALLASATIGDS